MKQVVETKVAIWLIRLGLVGAIAESELDCGHFVRFAGMSALGRQGAQRRECPVCNRVTLSGEQVTSGDDQPRLL